MVYACLTGSVFASCMGYLALAFIPCLSAPEFTESSHAFAFSNLTIYLLKAHYLDAHYNLREVVGASTKYSALLQKAGGEGFHGAAGLRSYKGLLKDTAKSQFTY